VDENVENPWLISFCS